MSKPTTSVLFVCLGNICRSPLAEGIFAALAEERGMADRFRVDSAGTGAYHLGKPPDSRSTEVARAHGMRLTGRARQVTRRDMTDFDVVVAMDRSNRRSLDSLCRQAGQGIGGVAEVVLMRDYDPGARDPDVPDPYYGGREGFERVHRILERACGGLLEALAGRSS